MRKILFCLFSLFFIYCNTNSQTISEKKLFTLTYEGKPDVYSFHYDKVHKKYSYLNYVDTYKKSFLIYNNSLSEKYDYISFEDEKTDSKGNSYVISGNYSKDYGLDNNFLLVNGKEKLSFDYIESYSSFINKNDELVFIFKSNDKYKIGKYSIEKGLQQSEDYELIKSAYKYSDNPEKEGDSEEHNPDNFYKDDNGERCFIAINNGKAEFIYESKKIKTEYSDINEASITKNNNNELSYIAKKNGRFYEQNGSEVVVSGNKVYDTFQTIYPPVLFNSENEPVYACSDSIAENKYNYYLVIAIKKQNAINQNSSTPVVFSSWISDVKINAGGDISYSGMEEIIIPAKKKEKDSNVYDEYYTKSWIVKNNSAQELGYNLGTIKYSSNGNMLYSGIADLEKKENLIIESNGISKIILSDENFDIINEYGYTANNEVYYIGQNYEDSSLNRKNEAKLFIGGKLMGKFDFLKYQMTGRNSSVLKFDSKNNIAYVAEELISDYKYKDWVYLNNQKLPFPENSVKGENYFNSITGLMFSKYDKLFYIGEIIKGKENSLNEIFIDNKPTGKVYDLIGEINYNDTTDEVSFFAVKDKSIYSIIVKF